MEFKHNIIAMLTLNFDDMILNRYLFHKFRIIIVNCSWNLDWQDLGNFNTKLAFTLGVRNVSDKSLNTKLTIQDLNLFTIKYNVELTLLPFTPMMLKCLSTTRLMLSANIFSSSFTGVMMAILYFMLFVLLCQVGGQVGGR